jgi:DNA-binding CsgD family transcriptional regulator
MGKTALLRAARERADGARVIEVTGLEAEANLPFAALGEIAGPVIGHLGSLTAPQRAAMRAALALEGETQPVANRIAACTGLLGLLRAAGSQQPLLIVIDDAQWLDPASRECLGYAARRLDGTRVGVLVAVRSDGRDLAAEHRLDEVLTLTGLGRDDALALLRDASGDLAPAAAERLVELAAGNPLALLELPALLSEDQRRGLAPFDPAPAPGDALWNAFCRRVAGLEPEVRDAVLVAAATTDRELRPVVDACRDLGIEPSALERAEEAGVLSLGDQRLAFSHPLVRGVVYRGASGADRRRVHAALAGHTEPDARAWHLAAATIGSSEEVAGALEAAGRRAASRGAHATAADALERAAAFVDDPAQRSALQLGAGLEAAIGGAYERATGLLASIPGADEPVMLAAVRHLLAMVTLTGGIAGALDNHRALTAEAEAVAPLAPEMAAAMHADAGVVATVAGDCRLALTSAERGRDLLGPDASPAARCHVAAMLGMGLAMAGMTGQARAALDEAGTLLDTVDPLSPRAQSVSFALHARLMTGQAELLRSELAALGVAAREAGGQGLVPYYLLVGADAAYRTGDWAAAAREIDEAVEIAEHSAQTGPLSIALVVRARIHAAHGRERAARDDVAAGVAAAEAPGYGSTLLWARSALGFLELGARRPEAAIEQLELLEQMVVLAGLEDPLIVPWRPDLVEAYAHAGRDDDARRVARRLGGEAERSGVPLASALAARCEGLTAVEHFDEPFERALAAHAEAGAPFEEARTRLVWGARLHRARRRVEARRHAHDALAVFEALGAEPWAERARAELRAAGGIERAPLTDPFELTGQERRVALAVARGATNREVAAELFLSPKTVEFHLGRVYRKLGVRSRTELAALVAEGGVPAPI